MSMKNIKVITTYFSAVCLVFALATVKIACKPESHEVKTDRIDTPTKTIAKASPADLVLRNSKIITLDAHETIAQALAIRGDKIIAVGTDTKIDAYMGPQTKIIDLKGKSVVPGLFESHVHALGVARQSLWKPYAELSSVVEIQDWIRHQAKRQTAGTWIEVPRNPITRIKERRLPTRSELDAACATHPVAFKAARKWTLNSLGFETVGITINNRNPEGVIVYRDSNGTPKMLAMADPFMRPFLPSSQYARIPQSEYGVTPDKKRQATPSRPYRPQQFLDALAKVLKRYNELGITSISERATDREGYDWYRKLQESGRLTTRVTLTFLRQMYSPEDVARFVNDLSLSPYQGDDWVKVGPLKIIVDGGIHWGTTLLREPYGEKRFRFYQLTPDPKYHGEVRFTIEQMTQVFAAGHRLGWPMCCHITGDAGVDRVLDALEAADKQVPITGRRFTLIHCYFPTPQAVQRGKRLGICVDTQPCLYYKDADAIAEVYGRDWAERFIGVGDWLHGGLVTTINSDHMIGLDPNHAMNPFNPFLQLYIVITRKNETGRVYGPHQKVSRLDALRTMTSHAAYINFCEDRVGSLEPGKLADLAVLDRDYLSCPEEEIRQIKPLMTLLAGRTVYQR
ncbi:MAG: amidohydrolase [Phycisphaerales bacterium]|nr:MAG: amidohydrolase [Phycisphaerales bacterium]